MTHRSQLFFLLVALSLSSFGQVRHSLSATELSMERQGLVDVREVVPDIQVSLMYARSDNFVGRRLYADLRAAYLQPEAAQGLLRAREYLRRHHPELNLIVFDAARPMSVQQHMWDVVKGTPRSIYVSNPARGGGLHNYGLAVDVALCWAADLRDRNGRLLHAAGDTAGLYMGTPIDHLGDLARVDQEQRHLRQRRLSERHVALRRRLRAAMRSGGFKVLPTEWWHFNFKTRAQARARYAPIR